MRTKLPRLLDQDLTEKARLRPSAASATMTLAPLSTATLSLPGSEPEARVRDFIELHGPEGSLGIFRVASARRAFGGARQLSLEHGACTLSDGMTGPAAVFSGSLRAMLEAVLACQSRAYWQLGDVEADADFPETDMSGMSLLEAILTIAEAVPGAALAFDQSAFPWTLHLRRAPAVPACECRLNRNLQGATVSVDEAALCTRVTVEDENGVGHVFDGEGIARWGVIHRGLTAGEGEDPETVARRYLAEHSQPAVSIELDALALAAVTGEPLDSFRLGSLCRVALPDWGTVLDERIVAVRYPDLVGSPGLARLTLCSRREDAATYLGRLSAAATGAQKGLRTAFRHIRETENGVTILAREIELRATKEEVGKYLNEVYIRLDASDASIALHAEHLDHLDRSVSEAGIRIDGLNADIRLWASRAEENGRLLSAARVDIDGASARITAQAARIDAVEGSLSAARLDIDGANAAITAQAARIDANTGAISAANLRIDGANAAITANAQRLDAQGNLISGACLELDGLKGQIALKASAADVSEVSARLDAQSATLELKVDRQGVIAAINASVEESGGSKIVIAADKINLSGYVTASQLSAQLASFESTISNTLNSRQIGCVTLSAGTGRITNLYVNDTLGKWKTTTIAGTTIHYLGY